MESIIDNELQKQLVKEFSDSRYFGSQHWFAARAEIEALQERIDELEGAQKPARAKRSEVKED